jgi:8-amino-7-oxononanoate synthase
MKEGFLLQKLEERKAKQAFRQLTVKTGLIDFCSNDYLGLARKHYTASPDWHHGSGGSRLLAGNYPLIEALESQLAQFHQAEAALVFNSGYDANLGLLSAVPQRGDTILYDYLSHASLRDGIRLSFARAISFRHNDLDDLESKLKAAAGHCFVVTESVFSMDGDRAPLQEMSRLCEKFGASLIVDEAHGTGVIGAQGEGLVQSLGLAEACFARIYTFGKAVGCHGAAIAGSQLLKDYLVNFARSFIYTTSLPETTVAAIKQAYEAMKGMQKERAQLNSLVSHFQQKDIRFEKLKSDTPIQGVIVPGNEAIKELAKNIQQKGMDVRPILYPTVPENSERLRIVLHAFNTADELNQLLDTLS